MCSLYRSSLSYILQHDQNGGIFPLVALIPALVAARKASVIVTVRVAVMDGANKAF